MFYSVSQKKAIKSPSELWEVIYVWNTTKDGKCSILRVLFRITAISSKCAKLFSTRGGPEFLEIMTISAIKIGLQLICVLSIVFA